MRLPEGLHRWTASMLHDPQVFYAPHIVRMSSVLGTRFEPLRYTLDGSRLYSNVYYRHAATVHP